MYTKKATKKNVFAGTGSVNADEIWSAKMLYNNKSASHFSTRLLERKGMEGKGQKVEKLDPQMFCMASSLLPIECYRDMPALTDLLRDARG